MLKVTWEEKVCIHAGECVKNLPQVFRVGGNTLAIYADAAAPEEIRAVVSRCPSGALTVQEVELTTG
jgi:uncharacterized Fe-S cluster protein YjdI